MSLTALPVTTSDLTTLQSGIQFFTNTTEANLEVPSINANQPNDSVFIYATKLLANNISLSQTAMAVSALMEGGTIAVGNTTTPNTLTLLSTQFLPGQVAVALANNFNPTVFAAESLGSALSTQASFQSFVGLNVSQFAQSVSTLTGVNVNAIQQFVINWQNFFTSNPSALQGRTVTQASYGSAFGDAVGVALLNPTTANLQTVVSTTPGVNQFIPNTVAGLVANALIDIAEGKYEVGKALGPIGAASALAPHPLLQGEAGTQQTTFTFTPGTDTFVGTNGDDIYNGNISGVGAAPATLSPLQFDSAKDIGGGNDRINLNVLGVTSLAAVASLVTGVENWSFNTGNGALNAVLDASSLDSAKFIEQIGGLSKTNWADVTKVGTGQTIAFTNQDLAGTANILVKDGVSAATVVLTNVDSGSFVAFNENKAGDLTTLTVNGSVADPGTLGIIDNATAVTTLNLGITSKATVNLFGVFQTLATVDGNKSTGDLTLNVAGLPNVNSVTMGSGNDKLSDSLSPKAVTVTTVTENLGAGNDTLTMLDLTPAIGPHNVAFNVTLGGGGDTVAILGNLANIALAPTAANFQQGFFTITDFNPTQDAVNVAGAGAFITLTAAQQTAISGSANLFAAVQAAFAAAGALGVFDFSFGGNTYIADNNVGVGTFDASDGIIQLTGVALAQLNNTNFIHA